MMIRLGFPDQSEGEFSALLIRLAFRDQSESEFSALVKPGLGWKAAPGVQIPLVTGH